MQIPDVRPIIFHVIALTYVGIASRVSVRRPPTGAAWRLLVFYALVGGVGAGLDGAHEFNWLIGWPAEDITHWPLYAAMSLSVMLLPLTKAFFHLPGKTSRWVWFSGLGLAAAFALDSKLFALAPVIVKWPAW